MKLKYKPVEFNSKKHAFNYLKHCFKHHRIMLGDNGKFWVVCPADAARLEKAGYEYAE